MPDPILLTNAADLEAKNDRALVLFSGGFDSTLTALVLKEREVDFELLTVQYRSRPQVERSTADRLAASLGVPYRQVALDLDDARQYWPELSDSRHEAWFPHRNLLFFGIAAHVAVARQCNVIAAGTRIWDTTAYSDATRAFILRLAPLLGVAGNEMGRPLRALFLPLLDSHALAVHAFSKRPDYRRVLESTWSCWRSAAEPCGSCAPCRTRLAFIKDVIEGGAMFQ